MMTKHNWHLSSLTSVVSYLMLGVDVLRGLIVAIYPLRLRPSLSLVGDCMSGEERYLVSLERLCKVPPYRPCTPIRTSILLPVQGALGCITT
ncbi:hypothetical protein BDV41DRAFT_401726 [Aspergillus transmontanensis]|uniref:Uncharacterized protein n=1 Tax=Aspergillus transmontanensis TaxID=1034304 RepID=A0A5N6VPE3_9EURO|nr:hypothetical protein BDV41DRAFT_401726 [Aspergillus transmontanensis]